MKLLLAEDEKLMAQALLELFKQEGYEADWFADGVEAEFAAESGVYDIIVLDVMMPGKDGFAVAKDLRKQGVSTPILMLTAKGQVEDKVQGLDSGADDYLTKPFLTEELLARLRALSRRGSGEAHASNALTAGDISLDEKTLTLKNINTQESVRLGQKEFQILEYFLRNQGRILTRDQLAQRIWGYDNDAEYNKIEVYLTFTRKKLAFVGSEAKIKAIRGVGYELQFPHEER